MNLAACVARRAAAAPARVALHFEGVDYDWAWLSEATRRLAGRLAGLGIGRGDRVAHLGANHPLFLVLLFACARRGAIVAPLNWRLAPPEHRVMLRDAEPGLLVHDAAFAAAAEALAREAGVGGTLLLDGDGTEALDSAPDAEAMAEGGTAPILLVYTSGTTGRPKGAVLTQRALLWNAVNSRAMHDLTSADHVLTTLPMFHVGGLNIQTVPALYAGARVTLHRRFDPGATLKAIAGRRPSLAVFVPAQLQAMIAHPLWPATDLSSLRTIATGSQIVPIPLIAAIEARGVKVIQVYGATETAPIALCQNIHDAEAATGSCGRPARHSAARIVDEEGCELPPGGRGEILVRGPNLMQGYWRDPAASAAALKGGWFHTGDIGHRDAEGRYYVDERKSDVIISGGENIYPAEIEAILLEDARLAEAAAVARPDPRWGEVPVAFVVPRAGVQVEEAELLARFAGRLARFKIPRAVIVADALPKSALGKVLRHELRRRLCEG
ncbi:MAG TPA: AMP-binding protein [Stellaceae bacterium]|nr:AMP-binding protein [Stellaceae bacterium]